MAFKGIFNQYPGIVAAIKFIEKCGKEGRHIQSLTFGCIAIGGPICAQVPFAEITARYTFIKHEFMMSGEDNELLILAEAKARLLRERGIDPASGPSQTPLEWFDGLAHRLANGEVDQNEIQTIDIVCAAVPRLLSIPL